MFHFQQSSQGYPASCHEAVGLGRSKQKKALRWHLQLQLTERILTMSQFQNLARILLFFLPFDHSNLALKYQLSVKMRRGFFCLCLARRATFSFFLVKTLLVFWGDSRWISSGLSNYHLQTTETTTISLSRNASHHWKHRVLISWDK